MFEFVIGWIRENWSDTIISILVIVLIIREFLHGGTVRRSLKQQLDTCHERLSQSQENDAEYLIPRMRTLRDQLRETLTQSENDIKELTVKFDAKIADSEKANRDLALRLRKAMEKLEDDVVIATSDSPKPAMPWGDRFNQLKTMQNMMAVGMRLSGLKEARESMKIASDAMKELNRRAGVVAYWSLDAFRDQENSDPDNPEDKSEDDPKGDAE